MIKYRCILLSICGDLDDVSLFMEITDHTKAIPMDSTNKLKRMQSVLLMCL